MVLFLPESQFNKFTLFWALSLTYSCYISMSLSVTFLTLDRLFTIILKWRYTTRRRTQLAVLNVIGQIILYFVFLYNETLHPPSWDDLNVYICKLTLKLQEDML